MGVPISIRLDDEVRDDLEGQARARGIGLATLIRELATRQSRRARTRVASEAVGRYAAEAAEAGAFYADWGAPRSDAG